MAGMFYGAGQIIFTRAEELRKNQTADEKLLWLHLKRNKFGFRFKRQHPIWMYIADFYCHELKLVIEVDGSIHNVKEVIENDAIRQEDITSFGIKVIRFTNKEIRTDIVNVLEKIQCIINEIRNNQQTMKSRISGVFGSLPFRGDLEGQKNKILNVYCTAGYPQLNSTMEVMKALQENGASIIELGMPYSDPLADGPVIQHSGSVALANGMTIVTLFEQLKDFRKEISIPVILMGYMNPVLQYGFEKFCADAAAVGIDGLILPDLPEYEFETEYGVIIKKYNLDFIFLVTPETSAERIKKLDSLSTGFLYAVSSSSTTGSDKKSASPEKYLEKLRELKLKNPVLVGFGISNKQSFDAVCQLADGAIIGSAYIKALENSINVNAATKSFLSSILG